ncbi:Glutamyl-tRNA(Gln) amidotransferase subunit A 2 [Fulvia fulva]|uniref:Glutamyl-tRNA(Gln) amidotransferase subunit A 2 n=1 Tax=Passalora fulva TaxID=5499 RepID=A0A9Q8L4X7_PASFU|nr:Glutamyl-tRNA(Gln) amidotransferase subunit A 2 [Fulvia fulva]KAK4634880.1 Glutamyl-tRNA(Gln) amidotransferase subunit A 2 [Fulvia fulva]KAK4638653.1 Glutamyl-tRNA(Gln) amidotransferase subunit A 2 [Fulvia fulva]UJO10945.1 Glutamyl-tRNA(Gln) amidotransferase subunit A 2 [Fulvia fulva]WPV09624.1 Glutamyl-tRNA(Gln) amidotransferase subunit A 2 [Fulvia fulva]WPV24941.1 Glutamyl-tRNA(Gln) amidotransferase subunit A 2 [Fulvia fulva]
MALALLAALSCMIFPASAQLSTFDPREATISSTHHSLYTGLSTCRDVVSAFLSRIEALNNHTNAIIRLNPNALTIANDFDTQLKANNGSYGPLFCIPILLKDNYDTADMPTTGGNLDLAGSQPTEDAPMVQALKDAGAIVLGKANLHELALEGLSVSSLGGQTINPYDSTRTPGGSSGGTGAAIAASFAVWGTGTDTVNSLRSPASANSLFSCRPTRGLLSRTGVIPISYTQDVVGPIARNVEDVATALTVMAKIGFDSNDNATALVPEGIRGTDYTLGLTTGSLKGLRLGLVEGFFNRASSPETDPINEAMSNITSKLRAAGATIISITETLYNATSIANLDTQRYEYRENMNSYLQRPSLGGSHPSTLNDLYNSSSNSTFLVIPAQYEYVTAALMSSTSNASYNEILRGIDDLTLSLHSTFKSNDLDALIYPQQKNLVGPIGSPSQSGRNGILAALTGTPVVTVPVGFSNATGTAPEGVPVGMEILGMEWTEEKVLGIAWQVERLGRVRSTPRWAKERVQVRGYDAVPVVVPDGGSVDVEAYPLGVLGE